jgi:hypothetical protein
MIIGHTTMERNDMSIICRDQGGQPDEQHYIITFVQHWITLDSIRNQNQDREPSLCVNFPPQLHQYHQVGYEDTKKTWMERSLAGMTSGVPNWIVTTLSGEWAKCRNGIPAGIPGNPAGMHNLGDRESMNHTLIFVARSR